MGFLIFIIVLAGIISAITGSSIRGRKKRAKSVGAVAAIGGGLRATYYISSTVFLVPIAIGVIGVLVFMVGNMIPVSLP